MPLSFKKAVFGRTPSDRTTTVRLQFFSCHLHALCLCGAGHCLQTGVQADLDALLFQVIFGKLCHLRVKAGHNLLCHVDDGDRQTLFHQVFCHLQSDEAASCDHGTLCIVLLQILPQARWHPAVCGW